MAIAIAWAVICTGNLPKVLAANAPEETALLLIQPLRMCDWLLSPFLFLLNSNVRFLTGWLTRKHPEITPPVSQSSEEADLGVLTVAIAKIVQPK